MLWCSVGVKLAKQYCSLVGLGLQDSSSEMTLFTVLVVGLVLLRDVTGNVRHFGFRETTSTLYEGNDPVAQLHGSNFTELLSHGSCAWTVEFYATWCGHCQRFASTWSALARNVKKWGSVIRVAALACSHPDNVAVCRQYHVQSYPSVKFFPPSAASSPVGERYGGGETVAEMRTAMIDYVQGVVDPPDTWPRLQPLHNLLSLMDAAREGKVALVFFEDTPPTGNDDLAREIVLDFSAHPGLVLGWMTTVAGHNHGVTEFPSLHRVNTDGSLSQLCTFSSRQEFGDFISKDVLGDVRTSTVGVTATWLTTTVIPVVPDGLHIQDLESSVFYSLWQEVARYNTISGELLQALVHHIRVMAKYYPGKPHTALFLKRLDKWLRTVDSVTGQQWVDNLNRLQTTEAYVPHLVVWTGCRGSQPHFRGYPCSLWTTYHTLTVRAYLSGEPSAGRDVLTAMRGYIKHYLGCHECAVNFGRNAGQIDSVGSNEESVLWLWRGHNRANFHLHGDQTEDSRHPKVQFPVYDACAACHSGVQPSSNYVKTEWNEEAVLQYLVRFYSESVVDDTKAYTYVDIIQQNNVVESTAKSNNAVSRRINISVTGIVTLTFSLTALVLYWTVHN